MGTHFTFRQWGGRSDQASTSSGTHVPVIGRLTEFGNIKAHPPPPSCRHGRKRPVAYARPFTSGLCLKAIQFSVLSGPPSGRQSGYER